MVNHLYGSYYKELVHFVTALTHSTAAAEDIVL